MTTGNRASTAQAQTLFEPFWQLQVPQARKRLRELDRLPRTERARLLKPTLAFVAEAEHDEVRAWGTSVLAMIGGAAALKSLLELVDATDSPQHKQRYRFTRFFAARALVVIAEREPTRRTEVTAVLQRIWQDPDERLLARAGAALTLAAWGDTTARGAVEDWLRADLQYWPNWSVLRAWDALFELHPPSGLAGLTHALTGRLLQIVRDSRFADLRFQAIVLLGRGQADWQLFGVLQDVITNDPKSWLREGAVRSLAMIGDPRAKDALLQALHDSNAQIRAAAVDVLARLITSEQAIAMLVAEALQETDQDRLRHFVDGLRRIDRDGAQTTALLSKELTSEDDERVQAAQSLLVALGGRRAMEQLIQRRATLRDLDRLLERSEEAVRSTFADMIRQARQSFYFAMTINGLVVLTGMALVVLAIVRLINQPENLERWILPGSAGLIGVLINLLFNNPRKQAKEDLTTLLDVTVVFLGFLRALNQIDATFKYAYLERRDFGVAAMDTTLARINQAVEHTTRMIDSNAAAGPAKPTDSNSSTAVDARLEDLTASVVNNGGRGGVAPDSGAAGTQPDKGSATAAGGSIGAAT